MRPEFFGIVGSALIEHRKFPALLVAIAVFAAPGGFLTASADAGVLLQTLAFEAEEFDLDGGIVTEAVDVADGSFADIKVAYNADRDLHSVVVPVTEHVEMAFVEGVAFDGITLDEVANLAFSSEAVDLPFSTNDCIVIRSDQGVFYKIGNAVESDTAVTFNYASL